MKALWISLMNFFTEAYEIQQRIEDQKMQTNKTFYLLSHKF